MKISYYTVDSNRRTDNGYGYAGHNMSRSLASLGHEMSWHDSDCAIELDFCQPVLYDHFKHQYKIGYTPWESSALPEGWLQGFNSVDEVWTPSEKCAEWYQEAGVSKPIYVYKHGIEPAWAPVKRAPGDKIKFLHVGEPAERKGGQMAMEAFRAAFGNRADVELTIKAYGHSSIRVYASTVHRGGPRSILGAPHDVYPNVSLITAPLSFEELVSLYHEYHVLVYPSWGEGFGFIPLQGLATGMPTICTGEWAPYRNHLGELELNSSLTPSPWPRMHPGDMYKPDFNHLVELYRYSYQNYSSLSKHYYDAAPNLHSEYNWERLTKEAFEHLVDTEKK